MVRDKIAVVRDWADKFPPGRQKIHCLCVMSQNVNHSSFICYERRGTTRVGPIRHFIFWITPTAAISCCGCSKSYLRNRYDRPAFQSAWANLLCFFPDSE